MVTMTMRKRDLLFLLWGLGKMVWKARRSFTLNTESGCACWAENGWTARKFNGTRTITIRINGGARDTGLHVVT